MKKRTVVFVIAAIIIACIAIYFFLANNKSFFDGKNSETVESPEDSINTTYDKISAYMEEECKKVYSPYDELLSFDISNYKEDTESGSVEATFFYKVKSKNYYKDPDTVGYIKEAKENGDSSYQSLYDDYLKPHEMNFDLKATIDANGLITLYSNSPSGTEWEKVQMSDFIAPQ